MNNLMKSVIAMTTVLASCASLAAPFDGNQPMLCITQTVNECLPDMGCKRVLAPSVNLSEFFVIDAQEKLMTGTHDGGVEATTAIERTEHLDGKLVLQGADDGEKNLRDGLGWTMDIDENSGRMSFTGLGDGFVIVAFGLCVVK